MSDDASREAPLCRIQFVDGAYSHHPVSKSHDTCGSSFVGANESVGALLGTGVGDAVGAGLGEGDWPSIDMPLSYTRTAAYRDHVATAAGVQLDGGLVGPLFYRLDVDGWWLPNSDAAWATEVKTTVHWRPSDGFNAHIGATAVVGEYPYGNNWHVLPAFDLIWRW